MKWFKVKSVQRNEIYYYGIKLEEAKKIQIELLNQNPFEFTKLEVVGD